MSGKMTEADWDTLRMVFDAGYEAAINHMQPSGPILFNGTVAEAWTQYRAEDAPLPDGLFLHDGRPHFHCRVCEAVTPFEGDSVMDFCLTDNSNICGGSPRCCP